MDLGPYVISQPRRTLYQLHEFGICLNTAFVVRILESVSLALIGLGWFVRRLRSSACARPGKRVANAAPDLIEKAAASDPVNATGDSVSPRFRAAPRGPVQHPAYRFEAPLGGSTPSASTTLGAYLSHDHIYFYASTMTAVTHVAYAPGDIHITDIASTEYWTRSPFSRLCRILLGCRSSKCILLSVRTLSSYVQSQLGNPHKTVSHIRRAARAFGRCDKQRQYCDQGGRCDRLWGGVGRIRFWRDRLRFHSAGVCQSGAAHQHEQYYTVCPIDYFTPGPKAAMEALLGRFDGGFRRTTPPICGQYNQDVAGSARGFWYHPGSPTFRKIRICRSSSTMTTRLGKPSPSEPLFLTRAGLFHFYS